MSKPAISSRPIWRRYDRLLGPDPAADVKAELRFHIDLKDFTLHTLGGFFRLALQVCNLIGQFALFQLRLHQLQFELF